MTRCIQPAAAREIAYQWHGGQASPLYAFASSGLISNLQALLHEIRYCQTLAETQSDMRKLNALYRFVSSGLIRKTPSERYPYAAPWAK